jgi:hypothetical protein
MSASPAQALAIVPNAEAPGAQAAHSWNDQFGPRVASLPAPAKQAGELAATSLKSRKPTSSVRALSDVTAAASVNVPGVPLPSSPVGFYLDSLGSWNVVYSVYLKAGDSFVGGLLPPVYGTHMMLFPPGTTDLGSPSAFPVAWSEPLADGTELLGYIAPITGTYYLEAGNTTGYGWELLDWSIWEPTVLELQGPSSITVAYGASAGPTALLYDYYSEGFLPGEPVNAYTSGDGADWTQVATVYTDADGYASYQMPITTTTYFGMDYDGSGEWNNRPASLDRELVVTPGSAPPASNLPVYRFYNLKMGVHFYTASEAEMANVRDTLYRVYRLEGVAYNLNTANPANSTSLYRFYNIKKGVHFYTASEAEKDNVVRTLSSTYRLEGVAYKVCATPVPGATPVYRFYNLKQGVHFYTASEAEKDNVVRTLSSTYRLEGVGYYLAP